MRQLSLTVVIVAALMVADRRQQMTFCDRL